MALTGNALAQSGDRGAPFGWNYLNEYGLRTLKPDPRRGSYVLDSSYIFNKAVDSQVWLPTGRHVYKYCPNGIRTQMTTSKWEKFAGWQEESRTLYEYDANDRLSAKMFESWHRDQGEYFRNGRELYDYNSQGLLETITGQKWESEAWNAVDLSVFEYNAARVLLSETNYLSDSGTAELVWVPTTRRLLTYNENADLESELLQVWEPATETWVNKLHEKYIYDDAHNLVDKVLATWDGNNSVWKVIETTEPGMHDNRNMRFEPLPIRANVGNEVNLREITVDEIGNPDSTTTSVWNNNQWVPVEKQVNYWSKKDLAEFYDSRIRCYYANPYTIGSIWKCDGLKQNVQYVMDVYDLQGRVRLNVPIPEDGTFRIMGRLDEGMHLMTIRGGLDIHTEKVLIAH